MKSEQFLSGLAVLISVVALAVSAWQAWRGEVISMRPLLVFEYQPTGGWIVRNVGNGPAMNVLIAEKESSGPWHNPMRVPPIAAGGERPINWLKNLNVRSLGVMYSDFKNRKYTSECIDDLSTTKSGYLLGAWPEEEIGRHWETAPRP